MNSKEVKRQRRHAHIRKNVMGSAQKPRLVVSRSNKHIYAQLVDDQSGQTLGSASDQKIADGTPVERAAEVGTLIAAVAVKANVERVVFDRAGYKYHGRVKALADGAREGGLQF